MKLTSIAGVFAVVLAVTAAFAFTSVKSATTTTGSGDDYIWIKYDCNNPDQVQVVSGGNTLPGSITTPFNCGEFNNVCAAKFLRDAQTELIPGQPNNRRPKSTVGLGDADQIVLCD